MAKEKPFNNPFGALKAKTTPDKPPAAASPPPTAKKKQQQVSADEESALFLSAMNAFEPVKPVREEAKPAEVAARQQEATDEDTESLLELAELVVGDAELSVEQTPTSVVACAKGFDVRLLGRLPPAARLDLQGQSPDVARQALERFVLDAKGKGLRCVRVVTGQPLRQPAVDALMRGKLARKVLAFSGGADALDLLLRR